MNAFLALAAALLAFAFSFAIAGIWLHSPECGGTAIVCLVAGIVCAAVSDA